MGEDGVVLSGSFPVGHLVPHLEANLLQERGNPSQVDDAVSTESDSRLVQKQRETVVLAQGMRNRRIFFSRSRVGWWEFSARLFNPLCCRYSTPGKISRLAAP